MTTIYGIRNCDTIKKTLKFFEANGIEYEFHDYKKQGCPPELVNQFLTQFSHTELINTRGTTWRKLDDSVKAGLDEQSAITLMSENPSMIKRPLIRAAKKWVLGYDETQLKTLVG